MREERKLRAWQDSERINLDEETEVRGWSVRLGVTRKRLKEAVQAVGDQALKVKHHLRGDEKPGRSSRGER